IQTNLQYRLRAASRRGAVRPQRAEPLLRHRGGDGGPESVRGEAPGELPQVPAVSGRRGLARVSPGSVRDQGVVGPRRRLIGFRPRSESITYFRTLGKIFSIDSRYSRVRGTSRELLY